MSKNVQVLAQEWVERDAADPYSGGYVGTIIDGLLNRIAMLRQALQDTRHGYAPYGERRYDEITKLIADTADARFSDRSGGDR